MEQPDKQRESQHEQVEKLVVELMKGVESFGNFDGAIGVSAVLTFTNRFMQTIVTLSPTPESKVENTRRIAQALKHMAEIIEFQLHEEVNAKVH